MIYLDTSALVKLHVSEDHSAAVVALLRKYDDPIIMWDLLEAELVNALQLKVFWKLLTTTEANAQIEKVYAYKQRGIYLTLELDRIDLMKAFSDLSVHTRDIGSRTLDILHVACARQLSPRLFVSFDERQKKLAELAGLPLWHPGDFSPTPGLAGDGRVDLDSVSDMRSERDW